eukprot:762734-Hanusia_phi.AAC.7
MAEHNVGGYDCEALKGTERKLDVFAPRISRDHLEHQDPLVSNVNPAAKDERVGQSSDEGIGGGGPDAVLKNSWEEERSCGGEWR